MNLGEIVTYLGLEGVSLCGVINMQYICAQWLCWKSSIWSEHVSHLPSECAGSYHLGEVGLEMEGLEPVRGVSQGFYAQWLPLLYWGQGQHPKCWSRSPEGQIQGDSIPSNCTLHHRQQWHLHSSGDKCQSKRSWSGHLVHAEVLAGMVLESQPEPQAVSSSLLLCTCQKQLPSPHSDAGPSPSQLWPHKCILSLAVAVFSIRVALNQSNRGWSRNLVLSGVHAGDVSDWPEPHAIFNLLPPPYFQE